MRALLMVALAFAVMTQGARADGDPLPATTATSAASPTTAAEQATPPGTPAADAKPASPHQGDAAQRKPPGGWKAQRKGGVVYWCMEQTEFGSRTKRETRCMTPEQFELQQQNNQKQIDDIRWRTPPPKGG